MSADFKGEEMDGCFWGGIVGAAEGGKRAVKIPCGEACSVMLKACRIARFPNPLFAGIGDLPAVRYPKPLKEWLILSRFATSHLVSPNNAGVSLPVVGKGAA